MPRVNPEDRRQAIIGAAMSLFKQDGFDAVRVDDILKEVSLSKGGFYHHFKSREEILREIVVNETVGTVSSLDTSLVRDDPIMGLIQLFQNGSASMGADVGILSTLESFTAKSIYLDELERQLSIHLKPHIVKLIERGVANKVFRSVDCAATAEIVMAVNDHGNRCAVLGSRDAQQLKAYNLTAMEALARHLGIEGNIQALLSTLNNESSEIEKE